MRRHKRSLTMAMSALAPVFGLQAHAGPKSLKIVWTTIFHAIHHLFRHLVVGDGALRTMTPRSMHRMI